MKKNLLLSAAALAFLSSTVTANSGALMTDEATHRVATVHKIALALETAKDGKIALEATDGKSKKEFEVAAINAAAEGLKGYKPEMENGAKAQLFFQVFEQDKADQAAAAVLEAFAPKKVAKKPTLTDQEAKAKAEKEAAEKADQEAAAKEAAEKADQEAKAKAEKEAAAKKADQEAAADKAAHELKLNTATVTTAFAAAKTAGKTTPALLKLWDALQKADETKEDALVKGVALDNAKLATMDAAAFDKVAELAANHAKVPAIKAAIADLKAPVTAPIVHVDDEDAPNLSGFDASTMSAAHKAKAEAMALAAIALADEDL